MSNPSNNPNGGNPMMGGPAWSPAAFNQMHGPVYQGSELELPCYGCSFPKAIARMYRKYFVFAGRASRSEFWWAYLYISILCAVFYYPVDTATKHHQNMLALVLDLLMFALVFPIITLTFRRLHDTNRSGWWIFAPSVPSILCIVIGLVVMGVGSRQFNAPVFAATGGLVIMVLGYILDMVVWLWLLVGSSKPEGARFDKNSMVWVPGSSQVTPTNLGMQAGMTYQPMAPIPAPTASTTPMVPTAPTAQASGGNTMPAAAPNMQGTANPVAGVGVITGGQQFGVQTSASTPQSSDTPQFGNMPQIQMPDFGAPAQQLQAMQTAQAERTVTPMPTPSTESDGTFNTPTAPAYFPQQPQQPLQSQQTMQQPAAQDASATPWNAQMLQIPQTPAQTAPAWQQTDIAQTPATAAPMGFSPIGGQTFAPTNTDQPARPQPAATPSVVSQPTTTQPDIWQAQRSETPVASGSVQSAASDPAPAQSADIQPVSASDQPAANQSASDQPETAQTTTDEANTTSAVLAAMSGVTFTPSSLGVPDIPAVKPQTVHGIQMPTGTYTPDADFSFMPDPQTPVMPTDPAQALQSVSFPTDEVHVPAQPQFPFTGQPTIAPTAPDNPGAPAIPTNFADFGAGTTVQSPTTPTTPWDVPSQDSKHNQDSENSHNSQA